MHQIWNNRNDICPLDSSITFFWTPSGSKHFPKLKSWFMKNEYFLCKNGQLELTSFCGKFVKNCLSLYKNKNDKDAFLSTEETVKINKKRIAEIR